jgi:hypothetical protein
MRAAGPVNWYCGPLPIEISMRDHNERLCDMARVAPTVSGKGKNDAFV